MVLFATQVPVANLAEVIQANAFAGNGAGLTNLGAANLTGTLPFGALPTAAVTNYQTGVTLSGTFGGTFNGNGAGLTNLTATALAASAYVNGPAGQTNIYASHGVYPFTVPPPGPPDGGQALGCRRGQCHE